MPSTRATPALEDAYRKLQAHERERARFAAERTPTAAGAAMTPERRRYLLSLDPLGRKVLAGEDQATSAQGRP